LVDGTEEIMTTCRECGHTGGPVAKFCTHCGAAVQQAYDRTTQPTSPPLPFAPPVSDPPPVGGGSRRGLVGVAVACGVAVAVIATFVLVNGDADDSVSSPPAEITVYQTTEVPAASQPTSDAGIPPDPQQAAEPEPDDAATALAELQRQREEDRPEVEALVGQWVPQLSAKRPGLVVNGITYDYVEILRDFRSTSARYPDALLLFSGDYSSFRYGDFWITVVPRPHADGPATNTWCDTEGIPVDDCYAKMISHTVAYTDATELRGH
jgi:hypothetical protein